MKRHVSVWMLMARSTIYKVLGLFLALAAADGVLFAWTLQRAEETPSLELLFANGHFGLAFGICLLILTALLCLTGCEFGAKQRYTLRRLCVSQGEIFVWKAVHNAVCYFLLWAVQTGIVLLLYRVYAAWYPDLVNGQTVVLAFYRNSFLHSLLPLADVWRYVRNAVLCVTLGVCAAAFPVQQRRGRKDIAAVLLAVITAAFFAQPMGSEGGNLGIAAVAVLVTVVALIRLKEVAQDEA